MQGGVADPASLPEDFLEQVFVTGERKGHYRAFINLIRNAFHWEEGHKVYGNINIPVHVIYGDQDWSKPSERQQTVKNIPAATMEEITDGGHFLSLDKPEQLINAIRKFAGVS